MEDQDYIVFENYIEGTLSEAEKEAFEIRLKTDLDYQEEFYNYKETSSFLEHKFKNEDKSKAFQNNLKNISKGYFETQETSKKGVGFKPWKYAVAASIALLIGVFMFNNLSNPVYSDFANYETISLTVRGGSQDLLKEAEDAFNSRNFLKANGLFKRLIEADKNNSEIQFYSAITTIELNDFEVAETLLIKLKDGNSVYKNKALWYLALSKLKQKDYKSCVEVLKTIPKDAEDYKEAHKLLKKLD